MNPAPLSQGILEPAGAGAALGEGPASLNVQITFMGMLADIAKTKKLALQLDPAQTLRGMLGELEERYGEEFACRIYRNTSAPRLLQMGTRIFVNGTVVDDKALDTPLPAAKEPGAATAIIVYFLPASCGG